MAAAGGIDHHVAAVADLRFRYNRLMSKIYDYVIIGSGFGGSVSAMRLTEKGYSVLVLEKGKRYKDNDFAKSNWAIWKYL